MDTGTGILVQVVRRAARRRLVQQASVLALWGAGAGTLVGAAAVGVARLTLGTDVSAWWMVLAGGAACGMIVGASLAVARAWNPSRAARELDRRLTLHDRLASGLDSGDDAFGTLAREDAERVAPVVDLRAALPWREVRADRATLGALAGTGLAVLGAWLIPSIERGDERPATTIAAESAEQIQSVLRDAREAASAESAAEPGAGGSPEQEALAQLEEELRAGTIREEDARARAAALAEDAAQRAEEEAKRLAREADDLRERLARAASARGEGESPQAPAGADNSPAAALREALARGDVQAAAEEVQRLAERAPRMSAQEREALANDLRTMEESLSDARPAGEPGAREPLPEGPPPTRAGEPGAEKPSPEPDDPTPPTGDVAPTPRAPGDEARPEGVTGDEKRADGAPGEQRSPQVERVKDALREARESLEPRDESRERPAGERASQSETTPPSEQRTETGRPEPGRPDGAKEPAEPGQAQPRQTEPGQTEPRTAEQTPAQREQAQREQTPGEDSPQKPAQAEQAPGQQQPGEQQPGEQPQGEQQPGDAQQPEQQQQQQQPGQGLQRLAEELRRAASTPRESQQREGDARRLREQAQRMLEGMSDQERRELERLARELGEGDQGDAGQGELPRPEPGTPDGLGQAPSERTPGGPPARATGPRPSLPDDTLADVGAGSPEDAAGPGGVARRAPGEREMPEGGAPVDPTRGERFPGERVIAEWEPSPGLPGGADGPTLGEGVRRAARGAERAVEQRAVPPEYADLVRRVFRRYVERVGPEPTRSTPTPPTPSTPVQ